jgi:uncharacterized membrane protein
VRPLRSAAASLAGLLTAASALSLLACSSDASSASPTSGVDAATDNGPFVCPSNDMPKTCPSPAPSWAKDVEPIFAGHCWTCHAGSGITTSGSGLDLGSYQSIYEARTTALSQVYSCRMPPSGQPQLAPADRQTLLSWFVCGAPND